MGGVRHVSGPALLALLLAGCSLAFTARLPDSQGHCAGGRWPLVDAVLGLGLMGAGTVAIGHSTTCSGDVCGPDGELLLLGVGMIGTGVVYAIAAAVGESRAIDCRRELRTPR